MLGLAEDLALSVKCLPYKHEDGLGHVKKQLWWHIPHNLSDNDMGGQSTHWPASLAHVASVQAQGNQFQIQDRRL